MVGHFSETGSCAWVMETAGVRAECTLGWAAVAQCGSAGTAACEDQGTTYSHGLYCCSVIKSELIPVGKFYQVH